MMGLKRIAACLLAGSLALSCIYPYETELDSIEGTIVIEGDIILGDVSTFHVSRAQSLDGSFQYKEVPAQAWVEDETGAVYRSVSPGGNTVDLTDAPADRRYRLHVADMESHRNYVSSWREPQMAPVIDGISFEVEPTDSPLRRPSGKARVSMTAPEGASRFFRWDYEQEWQFHANYDIRFDYDFLNEEYVFLDSNPNYWCWTKSRSSEAGIAIAIGDEQNKIRDHVFMDFHTGIDNRFQRRYAVHLIARGISEECYQYLHTLEMNSNSTGDLFAPNPSELRGNLTCEEDPDELVLGFIEVSRTSDARAFLPRETMAYLDHGELDPSELYDLASSEIPQKYADGWRPSQNVTTEDGSYVGWAPPSWCDCRAMGGTNVKPSYWED